MDDGGDSAAFGERGEGDRSGDRLVDCVRGGARLPVLRVSPLAVDRRPSQFVSRVSSLEWRLVSVEKRTCCCEVLRPESDRAREGASEGRPGELKLFCDGTEFNDGLLRIGDGGACRDRNPNDALFPSTGKCALCEDSFSEESSFCDIAIRKTPPRSSSYFGINVPS